MSSIDKRVVELAFDNSKFEKTSSNQEELLIGSKKISSLRAPLKE